MKNNENQKLVNERHIRMSDFEKGFVAMQLLAGPIQLGKKTRIIIDYDPQESAAVFKYYEFESDD